MDSRDLELHIDELVLDGVSEESWQRIEPQFRQALIERLTKRETDSLSEQSRQDNTVTLHHDGDSSESELASQLAEAVVGRMVSSGNGNRTGGPLP